MITLERLTQILAGFPQLTVGLIGDLFLDRYLEIPFRPPELSVETGLEAYQVTRVRNSPGALGTVMNNLAALGVGRLQPVTVIGDDGHGYDLLKAMQHLPVDTTHIVRCPDRLTPTYTKPLQQQADGSWRELNRLDVRTREPMSAAVREAVYQHMEEVLRTSDGLIVLDQISAENEGVIDAPVRNRLGELSTRYSDKLIYVDSRAFLPRFSFGILKGNASEIMRAADETASVHKAAGRLAQRTGCAVFCTLGEDGALVAMPSGDATRVPGYPVSGPVDIVGAGDSATSGMVLSLLAGADEIEAAAVGNLVASITVQQIGTTGTATPEQVIARWHETHR
jgi:bifunctional ADP-heptose synthase (sugar kinase/adenylyltransferase)